MAPSSIKQEQRQVLPIIGFVLQLHFPGQGFAGGSGKYLPLTTCMALGLSMLYFSSGLEIAVMGKGPGN